MSYSFSAVLEPGYASLGTCDPARADPSVTATGAGHFGDLYDDASTDTTCTIA